MKTHRHPLPANTPNLSYVRPGRAHVEAFSAYQASDRASERDWIEGAPNGLLAAVEHHTTKGFGPFVAQSRDDYAPVGLFGPWHPESQPEAEIKWSIWDTKREGQGLAYEAAVATRSFAYWILGWTTAVSYITPDNDRSRALAARLGALRDGLWETPTGKTVEIWRHPDPEGA